MGLRFPRKKRRHLWLSVLYRLARLPWAGRKTKLKVFLNLEWFFSRLSHEEAHGALPPEQNPLKGSQLRFLKGVLPKEGRVLDLGCGLGYLARSVAGRGLSVVAIDHDPELIRQAAELHKGKDISFLHREAREFLQSDEKGFDVILLSHVLEHLHEPGEFLTSLRPHGRHFFIEVPDFDASHLNAFREALDLDLAYGDADHISEFGREELRLIVEASGLRIGQSQYTDSVQRLWCERGD